MRTDILADNFCGRLTSGSASPFEGKVQMSVGEAEYLNAETWQYCTRESFILDGMLDSKCDAGMVRTSISIPATRLDICMPRIDVKELWLSPCFPEQDQNLLNWHRYGDGKICWAHPHEWIRVCSGIMGTRRFDVMVMQMVKNLRVLINYHWTAFVYRLRKWPASWPSEPHGYNSRKG